MDLDVEFDDVLYLGVLFHPEQFLPLLGSLSLTNTRLMGAQRILQQVILERQDVVVHLQSVYVELEWQLDLCHGVRQHGLSDDGVLELSYLRVGEDYLAVMGGQLEWQVLDDQVDGLPLPDSNAVFDAEECRWESVVLFHPFDLGGLALLLLGAELVALLPLLLYLLLLPDLLVVDGVVLEVAQVDQGDLEGG